MARMTTPAELGALARAARRIRGWSQQQAADAAGVSRRFVNMLEGGEHRNAEVWRVLALLNALDVELVGTAPTTADVTVEITTPASATVEHSTQPLVRELPPSDDFDLDAHIETFRVDGE